MGSLRSCRTTARSALPTTDDADDRHAMTRTTATRGADVNKHENMRHFVNEFAHKPGASSHEGRESALMVARPAQAANPDGSL